MTGSPETTPTRARLTTAAVAGTIAGVIALAVGLMGCGRAADGREGNRLYDRGDYRGAAEAFERGIQQTQEQVPDQIYSDLLNNAGATYFRDQRFDEAQNAFVASSLMSETDDYRSRASYNAGDNAYASGKKKLALDFFKQSLLAGPDNGDAKYNYEFVARQLENEQQQENQSSEPPPKPSEYAKQLKEQADALVAERLYRDANTLMLEGLKVDPTVQAFQSFIDRTGAIAEIEEPIQ